MTHTNSLSPTAEGEALHANQQEFNWGVRTRFVFRLYNQNTAWITGPGLELFIPAALCATTSFDPGKPKEPYLCSPSSFFCNVTDPTTELDG